MNGTCSAIDLGCQIGYFTFRLAESGYLALGIENNLSVLRAARLIRQASGIEGASFREMCLNNENVKKLPCVDVTIFLSLWHHLCRSYGFENARELLAEVFAKTERILFFETGQSDETYMAWSKELPDMTPNPKEWIFSLLKECGASHVKHLGTFPTYLGPVRRHLFAAYK